MKQNVKSGIVRFHIDRGGDDQSSRNLPLGELAGGSLPFQSEKESLRTIAPGHARSEIGNYEHNGLSNTLSNRTSKAGVEEPRFKNMSNVESVGSLHNSELQQEEEEGERVCEVCKKPAEFACPCNETFYCTEEHYEEHFDETHKYTCRVVKEQEEELQANNLMIDFNQQPHIDTPKRKIELLDSKWRVQDYKKNRELVIQSLCHNKEDLIQGVQSIYNRQITRAEHIKADPPSTMREIFEVLLDLILFVKVKYIYQQSLDYDVEHALSQLRRVLTTCFKFNSRIIKKDEVAAQAVLQVIAAAKDDDGKFGEDASSSKTKRTGAQAKNQLGSHTVPTKYDLYWIFSLIGYVANFFNLIQLWRECQEMYVFYGKQVQKLFGSQSLEASNVYFLIGIYYFERKWLIKARAAFDKALYLRKLSFGVDHASCAECLYNIALTAKLQDEREEAVEIFQQVLAIYQKKVGTQSLERAKTLEQLGRLALEDDQIEQSYNYINECHQIRLKLLRDPNHLDVKKSSGLLFILRGKVKALLGSENEKNRSFSIDEGLESENSDYSEEDDKSEEWQAEYSSRSNQGHKTNQENLTGGPINNSSSFAMDATFNKKVGSRHKSSMYPSSGEMKGKEEKTKDFIEVRATLRDPKEMSNQMLRKSAAESVIDEDYEEYYELQHRTQGTAKWQTQGLKASSKMHLTGSSKGQKQFLKQQRSNESRIQNRLDEKPYEEQQEQSSQDSGLFFDDKEKEEAYEQLEKGINDVVDISQQAQIFEQVPLIHQFVLSLNEAQLDIFNKTQIDFKPQRPLLVAQSFQNTLSHLQLDFATKSKLTTIPRYYILSKADRKVSIPNLKHIKSQDSDRDEHQELIKLLLQSKEMMNILKEAQRQILKSCIQYNLSLEYFTGSIRPYQMQEFTQLLNSQVSEIEGAYQMKDDATKFDGYFKKPPPRIELGRGIFATPEMARDTILQAVSERPVKEIFSKLDLNFSEKLASNFEVEQLSLINQLRYACNNKKKQTDKAKKTLVALLMGFDLRELYEFMLYNQFLNLAEQETLPLSQDEDSPQLQFVREIISLFGRDQARLQKVSNLLTTFKISCVDLISNLQKKLPMSKEVAHNIYIVLPSHQERTLTLKEVKQHSMDKLIDGLETLQVQDSIRFLILTCFVKRLPERLNQILQE